ncbi:MAG: Spx/MgsR family RNA polymerase-binding regulatory protein [Erysipelotrichaceae bacterium]|jgi:regulatory protein spx|nr:Spx/MgsR family RNA polymerase-binding regulatory protein [Erysipelotrichaceae bacterium]
MIRIYTTPSCSSCRKAIGFFKANHISIEVIDIFSLTLKRDQIIDIIRKSENSTDDIISQRSKIYKEGKVNFDDMTLNELITFIIENPSILKRPIIVDDRKVQVGYNEEEIRAFIPSEKRKYFTHDKD